MKHKGSKIIIAFLFLIAGIFFSKTPAYAETQEIAIEVEYRQDEARRMLSLINQLRTSELNSWVWNEDNTELVIWKSAPLVYDYELERIAMQRVTEIAISYSQTRPNGMNYHSAYSDASGIYAENILTGFSNTETAFEEWASAMNSSYEKQYNRRNMLNPNMQAIGIAHVRYMGVDYWVQEFSDHVMDATPTNTFNGTTKRQIDVERSMIRGIFTSPAKYDVKVYQNQDISDMSVMLDITNHRGSRGCQITNDYYDLRIENQTVCTFQNLTLTGMTPGATNLIVEALGLKYLVKVGVTSQEKPIGSIRIDPIPAVSYTGIPCTPDLIIRDGNYRLRKGIDYVANYYDNTDAGIASVRISGIGNYNGETLQSFRIVPRSLEAASINRIPDQPYAGEVIEPEIKITLGDRTLLPNVDYSVAYENNTKIGTAEITIIGSGNYTGFRKLNFRIVKAPIAKAQVKKIPAQKYTGKAIKPGFTISYGDKILTNGIDYTVTYKNNLNPGTARIIIRGKGNYTGTFTTIFQIQKAQKKTKALTIKNSNLKMSIGKKIKLKVVLTPKDSTDKVTFRSSNKKIATVSNGGVVYAQKKGTTIITVRSGSIVKKCKVTIR